MYHKIAPEVVTSLIDKMKLLPGILILSASATEFQRAREIAYEDENEAQGYIFERLI